MSKHIAISRNVAAEGVNIQLTLESTHKLVDSSLSNCLSNCTLHFLLNALGYLWHLPTSDIPTSTNKTSLDVLKLMAASSFWSVECADSWTTLH